MNLRKIIVLSLLLLGNGSMAARAQTPSTDQIAAGRNFARLVCAACHVVTGDHNEIPILRPPAPSFHVLAKRPTLTEQSLREFLASNHRNIAPVEAMPNPRLVDYQIDEIVAYFLSLKAAN